jgi:hypothetical protein
VTANRKLLGTVLLFLASIGLAALAAATHKVWPLFLAWLPLLVVAWLLSRPEPGWVPPVPAAAVQPDAEPAHGEPVPEGAGHQEAGSTEDGAEEPSPAD